MSVATFYIGDAGCWVWTGGVDRHGYGYWGRALAHRRMYEQHVGPIPAGLEIDHLCRNTLCVNPEHLEPVTHAENVARSRAGQVNRDRMLARTHCRHGHEYTDENTDRSTGWRRCRECNRTACRAYYYRRKASS